ncbi:uncharacterized protein LOC108908494 [Anoplophora glabripennis]|uniref:uncharacterized protein LOC108908494 n=1 Tax=Anoplophora glabripennis TaxID=217634 RepID=UPI000874318A|nr:uncharacterized protein LOC108908494 [Anoplophora glabripennis]
MVKMENLCLELCRNLLNSSGFDAEDFELKSHQKENEEIELEASNGNYHIIFKLASKEKGFDDNLFYFETENGVMYVENITVKGYHCPKYNQLNQKQLLSLFTNLAVYHSKLISKNKNQITNEQQGNVFQSEESQKVLKNLYKLAEHIDRKVDLNILKQGVGQLIDTSKEVLQPVKEKFCVKGRVFQKKILFNCDDDHYTECVLFNLQKGRSMSIIYDMLCLIYLTTDQEQRRKYFHEITNQYYDTLKDNLSDLNLDLGAYENEIKTCIPYVKLELVYLHVKFLCDEMRINRNEDILDVFRSKYYYRKLICELISEIYEYVLVPKINIEDCFKIVKDDIGTNYENLSYQLTSLDGVQGLLGEYYKLKITVTQIGKDRVFHLFAKFVPEQFKELMDHVFLREEFIYITFLSELKKVGLKDIANFLPKCYFVRQGDVIIFEDMSYSNYRALKCDEPFSYKMLQLVVKQFAKMHACTLLYEEIMSKKMGRETRISDKYTEYIREMLYVKGIKFMEDMNKCGIDSTVNFIFDQFPDIPKEITMEIFRERTRKLFDVMIEKFKASEKYRNVVCHGDIWGGNILFKFDAATPSGCCFVDYQLIRYNPPAHDLLAFLYINTDKTTRTKYMSKAIDQYYDELSSIFKRYDFDLNKIYPYSHYIDSCNFMKSQAVCLAALTYPNSLDRDTIQNISLEKKVEFATVDKTEVLQQLMKDNRVRARFREIVEDLYELCIENNLE